MQLCRAIQALSLVALVAFASAAQTSSTSSEAHSCGDPPNIIVILCDDLGWHDVSYNVGHLGEDPATDFTTPNIDKLANSGVRLSRYYSMTVCTPSRVAMLTGRQPLEIGFQTGVVTPGTPIGIPLDVPVLPEHMKELGYDTYMAGKWHTGYSSVEQTPIGRGFDEFLGGLQGVKNFYTHDTNLTGNNFVGGFNEQCACDDDPATENFTSTLINGYDLWHAEASSMTFENVAAANEGVYDTDLITDFLIEKIENRGTNPLFLYGAYYAPHDPFQAPGEFENSAECAAIANEPRRLLCAMMKSLDHNVGRIVQTLQDEDIDDETLIVFASDGGAAVWIPYDASGTRAGSNYPLRGGKVMNFEGGPKAPAFIWGEPLVRGSRKFKQRKHVYDNVFHVADWSLTLQEAAGSPTSPEKYYGTDVNGVSHISSASHWQALKAVHRHRHRHAPPAATADPPRGADQLMVYNVNGASSAARNNEYKLYRIAQRYLFDGHFDPSNTSREVILCGNPFSPACQGDRTVPDTVLAKLSVDPSESNLIDATDPSALNAEQLAAYEELSAYLDYWTAVQAPELIPNFFAVEFNDCNASPSFHDCAWAPYLDTPTSNRSDFGLDTGENCRANNALNSPQCETNRADQWRTYAS